MPPTTPPAMAPTGEELSEDVALDVLEAAADVDDGPPVGDQALAFAALSGKCAPARLARGHPAPPSAWHAFSIQHPMKGGSVAAHV